MTMTLLTERIHQDINWLLYNTNYMYICNGYECVGVVLCIPEIRVHIFMNIVKTDKKKCMKKISKAHITQSWPIDLELERFTKYGMGSALNVNHLCYFER